MANYVLVHGAFQGGWIWKRVAARLQAAGHTVYTPTMDGCAERGHQIRPGITMEAHAKELVDLMFYEDLQDVIFAGTSVSGITVAHAANQMRERISHLVFIEALLPLPGEVLSELLVPSSKVKAKWESTKLAYGPTKEFAESYFFEDLDPATAAWAAKRFTMFPIAATPRVAPPTDFWDKPWSATVINCLRSANPADAHQQRAAEKLKAAYYDLDANHYPMLSHPDELAKIMLK